MITKVLKTSVFVFCLSMIGSAAHAQGKSSAANKQPTEKRKTLSFEDELVEGSTQKPELFYLFQKKNFNYKKLIKLRENFLPEMRKTSEELQRSRGSN
jgi:hypothetical protein